MARGAVPARAAGDLRGDAVERSDRCPRCGAGDLFVVRMARRGGGVAASAYCAGLYDRERRRFVRRSCGYAAPAPVAAPAASADGPMVRPAPPTLLLEP